ncbi:hypothetical protein NC651_014701 [Populus alba x Populus x berolinensis]|nr:hypothetical protein NC651_014701 [Populus alba x Populus x berolinensis]
MASWDALSLRSLRGPCPISFPLKKYKDVSVHRWVLMALLFSSAREHYAFGGTLDDDSLLKSSDFNSCFLSELEAANTLSTNGRDKSTRKNDSDLHVFCKNVLLIEEVKCFGIQELGDPMVTACAGL